MPKKNSEVQELTLERDLWKTVAEHHVPDIKIEQVMDNVFINAKGQAIYRPPEKSEEKPKEKSEEKSEKKKPEEDPSSKSDDDDSDEGSGNTVSLLDLMKNRNAGEKTEKSTEEKKPSYDEMVKAERGGEVVSITN